MISRQNRPVVRLDDRFADAQADAHTLGAVRRESLGVDGAVKDRVQPV